MRTHNLFSCFWGCHRSFSECHHGFEDPIPFQVPHVSIKTRLGVDDLDTEEFTRSFLGTILPPLASSAAQQPYRVIMHCRKAWLQGLSPAENRKLPPNQPARRCSCSCRYCPTTGLSPCLQGFRGLRIKSKMDPQWWHRDAVAGERRPDQRNSTGQSRRCSVLEYMFAPLS